MSVPPRVSREPPEGVRSKGKGEEGKGRKGSTHPARRMYRAKVDEEHLLDDVVERLVLGARLVE